MTISVRFTIHVTPRSSVDEVQGVDAAGVLRLRVRAVPEGGKANESVCRLIAKELGIGVTRVHIRAGTGSRTKQIEVQEFEPFEIEQRWPGLRMR